MINFQLDNLEELTAWLKTCKCDFTISSMQGNFVHVRFFIPVNCHNQDKGVTDEKKLSDTAGIQ